MPETAVRKVRKAGLVVATVAVVAAAAWATAAWVALGVSTPVQAQTYEDHVKCNEAWRASPAVTDHECSLNVVNCDHFGRWSGGKIWYCYVDVYCKDEGVSFKGVISEERVKKLDICMDENGDPKSLTPWGC